MERSVVAYKTGSEIISNSILFVRANQLLICYSQRMIKIVLQLATVFLLLAACSSATPLLNSQGQMYFQTRSKESGRATASAVGKAQDVCEDRKKMAMILDQKTKYYGDIAESDYIEWQRISRVSSTVGVMQGGPVGEVGTHFGGATQAVMANCGYEATVTFDCK